MPSQSSKVTTTANGSIKGTEVLRPQQKKPIVWIFSFALLVVIVVAFVVAPIYSPIAGNAMNISFGSYDGKDISYKDGNYFATQFENYTKGQAKGSKESAIQKDAFRYSFNSTVLHLSLLKMESDVGITVSDQKVGTIAVNDPLFFQDGKFSPAKLKKAGVVAIENIREQIIHDRVANDLVNGTLDSPNETKFIIDMGRWTRSFEYVSFTNADFPDSQVIAYAQKNSKLFRTMELSSITLSTKADATTYRQQIIDKKVSFEDVAKAHSIDSFKDKAGLRGTTAYNELQLELTDKTAPDAIFALKKGEISAVLTGSGGFVLLRANSGVEEANTNDLGSLTLIRNYMMSNEKGTVDDYLAANAKDFAEKAKVNFEQTAKTIGKKVLLTTAFPINYSGIVYPYQNQYFPLLTYPATSENQPISNALENDNFFLTAFKLKEKEISAPVILQDMVIVMKLKTEKQASDTELSMIVRTAPQLVKQYVSNDLQDLIVQKDKLVDNFEKTYRAHFVAQ